MSMGFDQILSIILKENTKVPKCCPYVSVSFPGSRNSGSGAAVPPKSARRKFLSGCDKKTGQCCPGMSAYAYCHCIQIGRTTEVHENFWGRTVKSMDQVSGKGGGQPEEGIFLSPQQLLHSKTLSTLTLQIRPSSSISSDP